MTQLAARAPGQEDFPEEVPLRLIVKMMLGCEDSREGGRRDTEWLPGVPKGYRL